MNQENSKMRSINTEMAEALQRVEQGGYLKDEDIGIDFFRAWEAYMESGNERLNIYELCYDEEYIIKDMRRAGISEFTLSERSTAILRIVERLEELGCTLVGFIRVEREPTSSRRKSDELIPALLFRIN